jgi:hypothetical protein
VKPVWVAVSALTATGVLAALLAWLSGAETQIDLREVTDASAFADPWDAPRPREARTSHRLQVSFAKDASAPAAAEPVLDTPEHAVDSAVSALAAGDDAAFVSTLLPRIRSDATPEAIARCRNRVTSTRVLPDWETSEVATEDGHEVRRVSMFGKSMTGFHHLGAAWLADRLWCLPTGAP